MITQTPITLETLLTLCETKINAVTNKIILNQINSRYI